MGRIRPISICLGKKGSASGDEYNTQATPFLARWCVADSACDEQHLLDNAVCMASGLIRRAALLLTYNIYYIYIF